MIKGLTRRAQKILTLSAQEEARRFRSERLLPEHIVLAIVKSGEGTAFDLLRRLQVNLEEMIRHLEEAIPPEPARLVTGEIPPSPRVKTCLEFAASEATSLGSEYIGTEHFLLACLLEPRGATNEYLGRMTINVEVVRNLLIETASSRNSREKVFARRVTRNPSQIPVVSNGMLERFSRDLTELALSGQLDPVVGRDKEIAQMMRILARRTKNNPVLLGEPGVGKTALVEGLALRIAGGTAPDFFLGRKVLSLDIASIVAGTKYRGEFEDRIKKILKEVERVGNVILFIDEIHTIIGAGAAEGAIDASNIMKPALARGLLQCVGATTLAEYRKYFEKDAALVRRFQSIQVGEPTVTETVQILSGLRERYELHHNVSYRDDALSAAAELSHRYMPDKFLPDKAIDLIDEAGSQKRMDHYEQPEMIRQLEAEATGLSREKIDLVNAQDYERAASVRDRVRDLREQIEFLREQWDKTIREEKNVIDRQDIERIIADMTGIPLTKITETDTRRLLGIEQELHRKVIGQDSAIGAIASAIRRIRTGIGSPARPSGSFIFLGPSGVGKSLLARTLAEFLFGRSDALIRVDMSDYMEKHNASRLVGAPPGYVGYEEGGLLTEKVRRRPYSVILLDEIEKAHPDVFNLLLQILEEGEIQDSLGHTVNFRNCVIIMTSNAGTREISAGGIGFGASDRKADYSALQSAAMGELKRIFRPEFLNRVDDIIVFHSLGKKEMLPIVDILLAEVCERISGLGMTLTVSKSVKEYLAEKGSDPALGARPVRRAIQRELEDGLSMAMLEGKAAAGTQVTAALKNGRIVFQTRPASKALVPVSTVS